VVLGVPRWLCFDACPTAACLPYVAARTKVLAPDAKLVVMVSALGGGAAASCACSASRGGLTQEVLCPDSCRHWHQLWHQLCPSQVRDPVAGVFSAETMLKGMGVPLDWTLAAPLEGGTDPRFEVRVSTASRQGCCVCLMPCPSRPSLSSRAVGCACG
jgi:hypothetical protein